MSGYYRDKLAADNLRRCYKVAPPRTRQYLEAEIAYVMSQFSSGDTVLDLGCGYGRVLPRLLERAGAVFGIDSSLASLKQARMNLDGFDSCYLACMNAVSLGFADHSFDCVVCIQNGISAFHVDQQALIEEAIRVTKPGGEVLFSSYCERFWRARLEWFKRQSGAGLIGEIDWSKTGDGTIVCKDGFEATTVSAARFRQLTEGFSVDPRIVEIDDSSLFCELRVEPEHAR